jgi:hypothetical protein
MSNDYRVTKLYINGSASEETTKVWPWREQWPEHEY